MSHDEVKNPFPGLRPFEFGDNHLFFGRDQQTTELTTRLFLQSGVLTPLYPVVSSSNCLFRF